MRYRSLHGYKYATTRVYATTVAIRVREAVQTRHGHVTLFRDGELLVSADYAWDGPSGPTIDTRNFFRGSLIHDALYQLIREGLLGPEHRKAADIELRRACLEDGMSRVRAAWVYAGVRAFGARAIRPRPQDIEEREAP